MNEECYCVERAVIMAAGIGVRMCPLTAKTPKPLVRVHGERMIDTVIRALQDNGIREIYVVVGHLKEQFYEWHREHPEITLIENPYYATCNNISSLYVARDHLENCMILDGDQVIYNPAILDPHFTRSGYNAVRCETETTEWLMQVEDGIVRSCSRTGGARGWQLFSVSRWTAEDGKRLRQHLAQEFESGNRQIYWDDVVMFCHFEEYTLGIHEMDAKDIIEIDGIGELARIDPAYASYLDNDIQRAG